MKWLRLLVLLAAAVILVLAGLVMVGPLRGWAGDIARRRIERELAAALHTPVTIGALDISVLPPRVEAGPVLLGPDGGLARAAHVAVRLLPHTSLRQLRPVAEAVVDDVFVDVPRWVTLLETPATTPPTAIPPFRLRALHVNQANLRLGQGAEPLDLAAGTVEGALEANAQGRLHFAADARQVVLARRGAVLPLERLRGRGGETANGWRLTAVEAVGDGVQLASSAAAADRLPIRGRVALRRLAFTSDLFERVSGDAEVDAALIGRLDEPAAAGTVRVADFAVDGEHLGDVSATAEWNLRTLSVSAARLDGFGGITEASGELAMSAPHVYRTRVTWTSLDGRRLARLDAQAIKPFAANGRAELSGTLDPPVVRAEGGGTFTAAQGGDAIEWQGQGSYRAGAGTGEITATQARTNTLQAHLDVGPRGALRGAFDAAVANPTALGAFLPIEGLPNLRGALTASAQVSGTVDDPRLDGQLAGRDVAVLGVKIEQLGGSFGLDRAALRTPGITMTLWQGTIALSGALALDAAGENDWQVRATDVPGDAVVAVVYGLTGSLLPIGRGVLALELSAQGPWPRVQMSGSATMAQFWLSREWIQRATLQGSATWPRWQLDAELRNPLGQTAALRASGSAADDVALEAHSTDWELTTLQRGELTESGGRLTVDASLGGPLRALSGRATLRARDVVASGRHIGAFEVDSTAERGRWQMTATALDGALTLRGTLPPDAGASFDLQGEWTDARFGRLLWSAGDVWVVSTGTLQVSGRLAALDQLDATLRVHGLRIVNGPFQLDAVRPATLQCRRGACTLDGLELRGPDTELRAQGTIATTGALRLGLAGQGDLRLLELGGGPIESARGRFTVEADIRHANGGWDVTGQLSVDQAGLDIGAPVAITRTSGRVALAGRTVRIEQLGGRMGTGTFTVGGTVDLAHGPDLSWMVTDVGANLLPSLEVELSGRGTFAGTWEHTLLAGRIDVARMLYDRDIALLDFLPSLNRALAEAPRPPAAQRVDLDLHMVAPGELYVQNNVAQIEARADLHITGTVDRPVLDGRIEALDGQVTFRDRVFELEGATVDFRPDLGLTAALNISAESTIDTPDATYIVGVRVTGTTADPRVTLSSDDPGLTQTDLATLIAVGKTTAQMREGGSGVSFGLQQSTKQLLPIDRISFESTYSRTTGTFEPQLKLGKDLTDNLAVSVGQTFGVESRTTVEADYRLTPRVFVPAVVGEPDQHAGGRVRGGGQVAIRVLARHPLHPAGEAAALNRRCTGSAARAATVALRAGDCCCARPARRRTGSACR